MVHFEFAETINRPPEEVFTYLTDPGKLALWQGGVSEACQETDGPMDVGTRVTEVRGLLGRRMESTLEITAFEPASRPQGHKRSGALLRPPDAGALRRGDQDQRGRRRGAPGGSSSWPSPWWPGPLSGR